MKTITRRQFASGLLLAGAAALAACDNVATDTVAGADEAGSEITEAYFSDADIAEINITLKSEWTPDPRLRAISQAHGLMGLESGYHTDSTTLSITRPLPVYEYKDGTFEAQYPFYGEDAPDAMFFLFDGEDLVYLIESAKSEYGETYRHDWGLEFVAFDYSYYSSRKGMDSNGDPCSAADAYAQSTTKKGALIFTDPGVYLYDGVDLWLVSPLMFDYPSFDSLFDELVATPGLEDLDLVNLTDRQTFEYESPELVIDYNGKSVTVDSVEDYEAALESIL